MYELRDIPERYARYYCGRQLMQHCAIYVGLGRFPYDTKYQRPDEDDD